MKLNIEHQDALRREYGICATEACDACSKILGSVRYVRRDELGEWCSELCRDGEAAVEQRKAKRKGGRPAKYRTETERREANAGYQRTFRTTQQPSILA